MATPAQQFRADFEASYKATKTLTQAFRRAFNEEQANEERALYISPRLCA